MYYIAQNMSEKNILFRVDIVYYTILIFEILSIPYHRVAYEGGKIYIYLSFDILRHIWSLPLNQSREFSCQLICLLLVWTSILMGKRP